MIDDEPKIMCAVFNSVFTMSLHLLTNMTDDVKPSDAPILPFI